MVEIDLWPGIYGMKSTVHEIWQTKNHVWHPLFMMYDILKIMYDINYLCSITDKKQSTTPVLWIMVKDCPNEQCVRVWTKSVEGKTSHDQYLRFCRTTTKVQHVVQLWIFFYLEQRIYKPYPYWWFPSVPCYVLHLATVCKVRDSCPSCPGHHWHTSIPTINHTACYWLIKKR